MSTRSLTFVYSASYIKGNRPQPLVNIYKHSDGYLKNGWGQELSLLLNRVILIEGTNKEPPDLLETNTPIYCNGIDDFAATLVRYLKERYPIGGVYLYPPVAGYSCDEDYAYHIYTNYIVVFKIKHLRTSPVETLVYSGSWANFHVNIL